jgi:hypothetical protein
MKYFLTFGLSTFKFGVQSFKFQSLSAFGYSAFGHSVLGPYSALGPILPFVFRPSVIRPFVFRPSVLRLFVIRPFVLRPYVGESFQDLETVWTPDAAVLKRVCARGKGVNAPLLNQFHMIPPQRFSVEAQQSWRKPGWMASLYPAYRVRMYIIDHCDMILCNNIPPFVYHFCM